jgi:hypothetical protein
MKAGVIGDHKILCGKFLVFKRTTCQRHEPLTLCISKKCRSCKIYLFQIYQEFTQQCCHSPQNLCSILVHAMRYVSLWNIFRKATNVTRSRDSNWLSAGRPRGQSSSPGGGKNLHFSTSSRPALGSTQPPIQRVPGALSLGVKWPGPEADHSSPTSAKIKKMWIYTSTPPYALMA